LRERVDDIPELVTEFLDHFSLDTKIEQKTLSSDALELLERYNWPGNIRELKNLVERLAIMCPGKVISAKDVPPPYNTMRTDEERMGSFLAFDTLKEARETFEKSFIATKLQEFEGNISRTAEAIGVERSNLHKKIKAYGL
jgi:two-component system nitrogen regulation response regulator NtrX